VQSRGVRERPGAFTAMSAVTAMARASADADTPEVSFTIAPAVHRDVLPTARP